MTETINVKWLMTAEEAARHALRIEQPWSHAVSLRDLRGKRIAVAFENGGSTEARLLEFDLAALLVQFDTEPKPSLLFRSTIAGISEVLG